MNSTYRTLEYEPLIMMVLVVDSRIYHAMSNKNMGREEVNEWRHQFQALGIQPPSGDRNHSTLALRQSQSRDTLEQTT